MRSNRSWLQRTMLWRTSKKPDRSKVLNMTEKTFSITLVWRDRQEPCSQTSLTLGRALDPRHVPFDFRGVSSQGRNVSGHFSLKWPKHPCQKLGVSPHFVPPCSRHSQWWHRCCANQTNWEGCSLESSWKKTLWHLLALSSPTGLLFCPTWRTLVNGQDPTADELRCLWRIRSFDAAVTRNKGVMCTKQNLWCCHSLKLPTRWWQSFDTLSDLCSIGVC